MANEAFWKDFYRDIYGRPAAPEPQPATDWDAFHEGIFDPAGSAPQAAYRGGVALDVAPDRLAPSPRGLPETYGAGVSQRRVNAIGVGVSDRVNALGYRVPEQPNTAAQAIQTAVPVVQPERGVSRAAVPTWIARMAPARTGPVVLPDQAPRIASSAVLAPAQMHTGTNGYQYAENPTGGYTNFATGVTYGGPGGGGMSPIRGENRYDAELNTWVRK